MKRIKINNEDLKCQVHSVSYDKNKNSYTIGTRGLNVHDLEIIKSQMDHEASYFWMQDMYDFEVHEFPKSKITYSGNDYFHVQVLTEATNDINN